MRRRSERGIMGDDRAPRKDHLCPDAQQRCAWDPRLLLRLQSAAIRLRCLARCHGTRVSGWMIVRTCRIDGNQRYSWIKNVVLPVPRYPRPVAVSHPWEPKSRRTARRAERQLQGRLLDCRSGEGTSMDKEMVQLYAKGRRRSAARANTCEHRRRRKTCVRLPR